MEMPRLDGPRLHEGIADLGGAIARERREGAIGEKARQLAEISSLIAKERQIDQLDAVDPGSEGI
jgi:hypothetical protein